MLQHGFESILPPTVELNIKETWRTGIFGSAIGGSGLITADIDQDGSVEIIVGGSASVFGSNNFWYVLKPNATGGYTQSWISDFYSSGISTITAFDTDNDGISSVFLGLEDGSVVVYDGSTLQQIDLLASTGGTINQIIFADADNDSVDDIVVADDNHLFIYDADSLALKHQIAYGAKDFKIGNVDGDAANEIVLSSGLVLQLDGEETTVEWTYAGGEFGWSIELLDTDADGIQEIIGASPWYYITAFDADLQSPKWQIETDLDIGALKVADIDQDGVAEILYGDGQWGEIHAYDAATLTEELVINNPEHGVTNIAVVDADGDGDLEIVWGAGATSTGADHLYVYDIATKTEQWQSKHLDGPFYAMDVGDADNDGNQELIFASIGGDSGYGDGVVSIVDANTHATEWQSQADLFGGFAWTGVHDIELGDVNDDGVQDIVVGTDRLYNGAIYVIDGQTRQIQDTYFYDEGAPIRSLAIADVDNDGNTEIIAGGSRESTGAPGVYTYILDGETGAVEWKSISLGDYWSAISEVEVGNTDNDAAQEIVAVNDSLFVFDGKTHQQWQSSFKGVTSAHLQDLNQDGKQEILAGTSNGRVVVLEGQTFQTQLDLELGSGPITGLQAYDFDYDGSVELVYTNATSVGIYSFEQSTTIWQSKTIGTNPGDNNSLIVADTNRDGKAEIIVGTNYTVVEFEVDGGVGSPVLTNPIKDSVSNNKSKFLLDVGKSFSHPDGILSYSAVGLPQGLVLDSEMGVIEGTATDVGEHTITVTATNTAGLSVSDSFELTVFKLIRLTQWHDTAFGTPAPDQLEGLEGSDHLSGRKAGDQINGGSGRDRLFGNSGDDHLSGGLANDILEGGIGPDTLDGGSGADQLAGGDDSDIFVLRSGGKADVVLDFQDGIDFLGLSDGLTYGDLTITQKGDQTLISDLNGVIAKLQGTQASLISQVDVVAV